jgi:mannitol/fructose-specific phosphotransferase system IIA component (Ntr-type)
MRPLEPLLKTAPLLVPILRDDDPLEALVSLAQLIGGAGRAVQVVSIKEVPHQSPFWLFDGHDTSARARFLKVAEAEPNCAYEGVLTRRLGDLLRERASDPGVRWVVMSWPPSRPWWRALAFGPLYRFVEDPPCSLAVYRPAAGLLERQPAERVTPRTLLVLVSGRAQDFALVEFARSVAAWSDATTITLAHVAPAEATRDELLEIHSHHDQLTPAGSTTAFNLVRSSDPLKTVLQLSKRFDLLVLGRSPRREPFRWQRDGFEERVAARAECSVIQIKPSQGSTDLDARPSGTPPISALLDIVEVVQSGNVANKRELFSRIGQRLDEELGPRSGASFDQALWERELEESSLLSHGVAAPDRTSFPSLRRAHVGVWILEEPISFEPDSAPVDLCFVLVGPPSVHSTHFVLMDRLRQLAAQPRLLKLLRSAETLEEATFALRVAEQGLQS